MADDAKVPDMAGLSTVVPHFHYDLIGRIAPGMYLVLCLYWVWIWICKPKDEMASLTAAPYLVTMILAVLLAYVVGFILGPLSYFLFDCYCRFSKEKTPAIILEVIKHNGWESPTTTNMDEKQWNKHLQELSDRSTYMLWRRSPLLALTASRWDAEAFAARQFGTATIILAAITLCPLLRDKDVHHKFLFTLFLVVLAGGIFFLCLRQSRYSRRRAIESRFVMLASLPPDSPADARAIASGR